MGKVLFILICLFSLRVIAQTDEILLLKNQLATARTTKEKFGAIYRLCEYYGRKGNTDSMRIHSSHLLDIAKKEKDDSLLIRAYIQVNSFYWVIGDFPLSIEYSFKAINLAEKMGNYRVCAGASSNVAWAYM